MFIQKYKEYYEKITRAVKSEGALYITVLIRCICSTTCRVAHLSFGIGHDVPIFDFLLGTAIGLIQTLHVRVHGLDRFIRLRRWSGTFVIGDRAVLCGRRSIDLPRSAVKL